MSEFDLIARIRSNAPQDNTVVGIGDDAAVFAIEAGNQVVACCDTLVEQVHFFADDPAPDVGYRSLAVNISDLAAMGARPGWALLAVSAPSGEADWIAAVSDGVIACSGKFGMTLAGGDISVGPKCITVTAVGQVPDGKALTRAGASAGELIVLSGCTGRAALAVHQRTSGHAESPGARESRLRPVPRIGLGRALVGKATACVDVSDGLLADLKHLLKASGCGAKLDLDQVPIAPELESLSSAERERFQLAGGDDYELVFTLPVSHRHSLEELSEVGGVSLTVIGQTTDEADIRCYDGQGRERRLRETGYEHFA
ncbi:MAG: thiamine-phosphate kinase [Xanthomonadales bacterium]|nr:thiamine-phosphate kinase [Xanthomonadales bacterium]